eukprot:5994062-Amphidinium_carterae.1
MEHVSMRTGSEGPHLAHASGARGSGQGPDMAFKPCLLRGAHESHRLGLYSVVGTAVWLASSVQVTAIANWVRCPSSAGLIPPEGSSSSCADWSA